jgi:hypothetical protein
METAKICVLVRNVPFCLLGYCLCDATVVPAVI